MTKTILLFGPTASGKTRLSIDLAKKTAGEIISADSMQVYRYMDIGTAKPSREQRSEVPHHLIDVVDPDEEWTVSKFIQCSVPLIKDIIKRGKQPIIVGGTGLYLNAFINGYSFPVAEKDENVRKRLSELETKELFSRLCSIDPLASKKINKNDKKRMVRALEVHEITGLTISSLQKKKPKGTDDMILICLNPERQELYSKINARVDSMMKAGLVDEVRSLLAKGYSKDLNSMQALGYKEVVAFLQNKCSLEETIDILKQKTRNFARRQLTWFRRFENVNWIGGDGTEIKRGFEKALKENCR